MSQTGSEHASNILSENYETIVKDGADRADHPTEARAWLTSFGNFEPRTEVSKDLLGLDSKSLLPTLTLWLKRWSQRTQTARKPAKSTTVADDRLASTQTEEDNLRWLFNYVFDYLGLDHDDLPPRDLRSLCDVLLQICQTTTSVEDIEACTRVIYGILKKWTLPHDAIEQVLEVLCNTRTSLHRSMPAHLVDCITLLVTGDMCKVTMRRLRAFITNASTAEANKKSMAGARGSVLFLGDLIKGKHKSGAWLVDFPDLIQPLQTASGICAPRLCTDIMNLCSEMILEPDILATILVNFVAFMDIVTDSAIIAKVKAAMRQRPDLAKDHTIKIDKSDSYQQANIASTKQVKQTLLKMWMGRKFSDEQRSLVYRFIMDTPDDTDEATLTLMLNYAKDEQLCHPDKSQSEVEMLRITRSLVQNKTLSDDLRDKAINVVHEAAAIAMGHEAPSGTSPDNASETGSSTVVNAWTEQLEIEDNPVVARRIAHSLQQIVSGSREIQATPIICGLESLVFHEHTHQQSGSLGLLLATQTLASIVLQGSNATAAFNALLKIASVECKSTEARVEAFRFLFRLRCDSSGTLYIQDHAESQHIASALCRTRESFDAFSYNETVDSQRKSGSSTSLSTKSSTAPAAWIYPDTEAYCAKQEFVQPVVIIGCEAADRYGQPVLDIGSWLITLAECLQRDQEWETRSYLLVHAGAQLANTMLFSGSDKLLETIVKFRQVVCERLVSGQILKPPTMTGLKDSDVAICLFNILTALIPYATIKAGPIQKGFADELLKVFLSGIGGAWEGTSRGCIHALSVCCLELPASVASFYPSIVDKMSKNMTQSHLSMHILEFLAQVARLPALHLNFQENEVQMIFTICMQFLERARERPTTFLLPQNARNSTPAARQSGLSSKRPPYRAQMLVDLGLSQYNSALAYHVMIFWFLSVKLSIRATVVKWIIPRLVWKDRQDEEQIDEQSMVFIDMMQRTAYSDLGETHRHPEFAADVDGKISSDSWVVGESIVTIETAGHTGLTQITKRQASGTTHAVYQQHTAPLPSHHVPMDTGIRPDEGEPAGVIEMLPPHILLQMAATAEPVSRRKQPVLLPKDDKTRRAIQSLDRIVTVDSHKLGIMYIGPGQVLEKDYLANPSGSLDYHAFLDGMGTRVSLSPPLHYNPQGLQNGVDGTETYAWRDRVTEIVYHIPTMMPNNLTDDPGSTQKKSHVGNCHVNIIYNRSGLPWDFGNFSSQLNYVNIVVEPANRPAPNTSDETIDFFRVHTLTASQFPSISPASDPKVISAAQLPQFVRLVALNANVFCQAWNVRDTDTEFPSSWRARLQAIKRLREERVKQEEGTLAQQVDFAAFTLHSPE